MLLGGAAGWPMAAQAQQSSMPQIGFLQPGSPSDSGHYAKAFLEGLRVSGYNEGKNVAVAYRWAEGHYERMPELAAGLVDLGVTAIAAGGPAATFATKAATSTIPIVFIGGSDPVKEGLVASLARPGGNLTGVTVFTTAAMWSKRLELLRDLKPEVGSVAVLANSQDTTDPELAEMVPAASALGVNLSFLTATKPSDIESAFATAVERRVDGLLVSDKPFFTVRHAQIVARAARYSLPAVYGWREYVAAGGLISYGSSLIDAWHQVGVYTGRILKGAKPADLPVIQPSRFELAINAKTAKVLGLRVPGRLLALADEVIE
jgi:putative ABC transport system substrate-binding protein